MKHNIVPRLFPLSVLLYSVTSTLAQDVAYNYDRDVNFAGYKTYQWGEARAGVANQLRDKDIRRAIEAQLAEKGCRRSRTTPTWSFNTRWA